MHPGCSHAWTFFPFFALLIRCVVGVYVISSFIVPRAPRGSPSRPPKGAESDADRRLELVLSLSDAKYGSFDGDKDCRRRGGLNDVGFSWVLDNRTEVAVLTCWALAEETDQGIC